MENIKKLHEIVEQFHRHVTTLREDAFLLHILENSQNLDEYDGDEVNSVRISLAERLQDTAAELSHVYGQLYRWTPVPPDNVPGWADLDRMHRDSKA